MTIPPYSTQQAIFWGTFVEAAYDMYKELPRSITPKPTKFFPAGWTLTSYLTINPIDRIFPDTEFIGFVAQLTADPTQYAVVFRGTESDVDWIGDFEIGLVPFSDVLNGGRAEDGFTEMYNSIRSIPVGGGTATGLTALADTFQNASSVIVAGHSLGGALAIMYSLVFAFKNQTVPLACYTLAAPMVGDAQFVSTYQFYVKNNHRIYNFPDIVPRVPGTVLGYEQIPDGIEINSLPDPNIHWTFACFHSIIVYLTVLGSTEFSLGDCAVTSAVSAAQAVLPSAATQPTAVSS